MSKKLTATIACLLVWAAFVPERGAVAAIRGTARNGQKNFVAARDEQTLARIKQKVVKLRQLKFLRPVPSGVRTKAELRQYVVGELHKQYPPERMKAVTLLFRKLRVIPDNCDLEKTLTNLLIEQIAGFYDWRTKTLYVMKGMAPGLNGDVILAHELTHALQDQHFDLSTLPLDDQHDDDVLMAIQCLVEGDATLLMMQYALSETGMDPTLIPDVSQLMRSAERLMPIMGGPSFLKTPEFLRKTLIFPYIDGLAFVETLYQRDGWNGVNQAFRRLPVSTEQILHVDKYLGPNPDFPMKIVIPGIDKAVNSPWKLIDHNVIGEYCLRLILEETLKDKNAAMVAAAGWDGDRLYVFSKDNTNQIAFAWMTTWDSESDAREFYDAWKSWVHAGYPGDKLSGFVPSLYTHWTSTKADVWLEIRGKDVLIVDGFSPAVLTRVVTSSWGAKKQMLTPAMVRVRKKAKGSTRQ